MLPPIDSSLLPADVRKAGPKGQQLYAAALGFEQSLVNQLTQQLAQSAQPQDQSDGDDSSSDDGSDGDASTSMYTSMLPDAMSQGITAAGGIGLADQLYRMLSLGQAGLESSGDAGTSGGDAASSAKGTA